MKDKYLHHPELLQGQPKRSIADYVEQNGILVPRRFESLEEARKSGLDLVARSEHPQDYDGCSGLFLSPRFPEHSHAFKWDESEEIFINSILNYQCDPSSDGEGVSRRKIKEHCKILQIDYDEFIGQLSYSYWEKIPGINITITADSAVKDRYHITTRERNEGGLFEWWHSYNFVENGCLIGNESCSYSELPGLPLVAVGNFNQLIELYEHIRSLPRFDSNHCPTMEFVTRINGNNIENYSLQYHRTRDFDAPDFELGPGNLEATEFRNVRGKTPPEGIDCKVVIAYAAEWVDEENFGPNKKWSWYVPEEEEGAIEAPVNNKRMDEIMSKRRSLQISDSSFFSLATGHGLRSLWFKPRVSIISSEPMINGLFKSNTELRRAWDKAEETGENQYINLHVVSDGRKAFVKRI